MQTIPKCCDVVVKHKKGAENQKKDTNKDSNELANEQERKNTLLKP